MHEASFEKMRAFRNVYVTPKDCPMRVLDIGSGTGEQALSYRALFESPDFDYVGLDIENGPNVDVVPADPYCWDAAHSLDHPALTRAQLYFVRHARGWPLRARVQAHVRAESHSRGELSLPWPKG